MVPGISRAKSRIGPRSPCYSLHFQSLFPDCWNTPIRREMLPELTNLEDFLKSTHELTERHDVRNWAGSKAEDSAHAR